MMIPNRTDLPFFSYGLFHPGELGFLRIAEFIERIQPELCVMRSLLIRDGLAVVDKDESGQAAGAVIWFKSGQADNAYRAISELEPDHLYLWGEVETRRELRTAPIRANILYGRAPRRGSRPDLPWKGREDPIFTQALDVIEGVLAAVHNFDLKNLPFDQRPLFHLQMAYLLLWSAIERYMSLRYGLGEDVMKKLGRVAEEVPPLRVVVAGEADHLRPVYRSSDPHSKVIFRPDKPADWLSYFYQVRSNVTHRGKAAYDDFHLLHSSLGVLLRLFRLIKDSVFDESESLAARFRAP